jgi:hypothetical protein
MNIWSDEPSDKAFVPGGSSVRFTCSFNLQNSPVKIV